MSTFPYKRVVVIGVTGSGKSTLAEKLANRFGMAFIELDALHWEPNWQEAGPKVFRSRVQEAMKAEEWVIAGNYREVRDITWPQAEAIIWLDYPLLIVLGQLTRRSFKRWWTRELLWGTNRESMRTHLKLWSQESLFHWLFKTYWRRKKEYTILLSQDENQHLQVIRLKHPGETQMWLENLCTTATIMEQKAWISNSGS